MRRTRRTVLVRLLRRQHSLGLRVAPEPSVGDTLQLQSADAAECIIFHCKQQLEIK